MLPTIWLRPNSITLSWSQTGPKLVADRSEAGRRPAASWNLVYHLTRQQRASRSATSLGPVCDQDSVMEFGLDHLRTGLRPGSSRFELMSRHVEIDRTCSNLVADLQRAEIWPITHYLARWALFHILVCSSFFFFLSLPNLSRCILDVYHTSTHDVALVRN